jgi:hypothetical protein
VERALAFMACSLENSVSLCGVGVFSGTTLVQHRRTSRNKEGTTGIHPCVSIADISILYYYIFTCFCLYAYLSF